MNRGLRPGNIFLEPIANRQADGPWISVITGDSEFTSQSRKVVTGDPRLLITEVFPLQGNIPMVAFLQAIFARLHGLLHALLAFAGPMI